MTQGAQKGHTKYWEARGNGRTISDAALAAGISRRTADSLERARVQVKKNSPETPVLPSQLGKEATRALSDFAYFQRRYFGRIPYYWQVEAAIQVVELLESPDKEYLVVNAPPGCGKTTLFTHDIPAWLTVRNRQIRGMMGAATTALASRYTDRLRRSLARTIPEKASDDDKVRGYAVDAHSTLAADFGRFEPIGDTWTRNAFVVQQFDDFGAIAEKEPTWSGYGQDAGFIGGRFDFVIWDDLVDPKKQKTVEAKEDLQNYWDDVSEPRLEPSGLLVLQGQRFSSDDLYRYNLDKVVSEDIDDEGDGIDAKPKYHHIKFKAHYDDRCTGTHKRDAPAYPDGCLLSPYRLPWRELSAIANNRQDRFEVVYQQEDSDPSAALVKMDWIVGRNGSPGCIDTDRDRLELPRNLAGELISVMCVDPSPTKYWGILWYIYQPATELRWLMDLHRGSMEADEFLDFNYHDGTYSGLLDEWVQTSRTLGQPITHVVVESNAAQRFLLQYRHVRDWMSLNSVEILPHETHRNKSDPELGVESIRQHFQFGRYRLPNKRNSQGYAMTELYIKELSNYPHGRTDDLVMATWFLEWNLPRIYSPQEAEGRQSRPSWAKTVPDLRKKPDVDSRQILHMKRLTGVR